MATRKGGDGKRKGSKRSAQNGYRLNSPTSPYPVHIPCLHRHYSSTPLPSAPVNVSMHPSVHLVLLNSIVLCFASKAEYRARLKALANEVTDELNIIRHEAASDELARKYFPEVRNRFINHILFIYNAGDDAIRQKEKSFNQKQFKKHMLKLRKIRDDVLFGLKNEEITQELEIAGLEALLAETKATLKTVEGQNNRNRRRVMNRRQRRHRARGNRRRARRFRHPQFELPDRRFARSAI